MGGGDGVETPKKRKSPGTRDPRAGSTPKGGEDFEKKAGAEEVHAPSNEKGIEGKGGEEAVKESSVTQTCVFSRNIQKNHNLQKCKRGGKTGVNQRPAGKNPLQKWQKFCCRKHPWAMPSETRFAGVDKKF